MDTLTKHIYTFVSVIGVALAVTLAVVIGRRLSDEAISILGGAVCGVGASIPTSLLVVWVTRRRQREQRPSQPLPGVYPPPVVVQPPFQSDYLLPSVPLPTRGPIILDLDGAEDERLPALLAEWGRKTEEIEAVLDFLTATGQDQAAEQARGLLVVLGAARPALEGEGPDAARAVLDGCLDVLGEILGNPLPVALPECAA